MEFLKPIQSSLARVTVKGGYRSSSGIQICTISWSWPKLAAIAVSEKEGCETFRERDRVTLIWTLWNRDGRFLAMARRGEGFFSCRRGRFFCCDAALSRKIFFDERLFFVFSTIPWSYRKADKTVTSSITSKMYSLSINSLYGERASVWFSCTSICRKECAPFTLSLSLSAFTNNFHRCFGSPREGV